MVGPAVLVGQEGEKDGTCPRGVTSWSPPLMAAPPTATPKLPQHQHHPKSPRWGDTRASPVPPDCHPMLGGLSWQRVGICTVSPEALSPQILPPASAN